MYPATEYRRAAEDFLTALRIANKAAVFDAVLVGSVARGSQTSKSDIDVLLISEEKLEVPTAEDPIHLQIFTRDGFIGELRKGDDFAAWCVRHGELLVDSGIWTEIKKVAETSPWPDWKEKVSQAARRLIFSDQLLQIGDLEAASEEMLYAGRHTARAILLKAGVFPLSGPELVEQLLELRQRPIADLLFRLSSDGYTPSQLRTGRGLLKKILVALDVPRYSEVSKNFVKIRQGKIDRMSKEGTSTRPIER